MLINYFINKLVYRIFMIKRRITNGESRFISYIDILNIITTIIIVLVDTISLCSL